MCTSIESMSRKHSATTGQHYYSQTEVTLRWVVFATIIIIFLTSSLLALRRSALVWIWVRMGFVFSPAFFRFFSTTLLSIFDAIFHWANLCYRGVYCPWGLRLVWKGNLVLNRILIWICWGFGSIQDDSMQWRLYCRCQRNRHHFSIGNDMNIWI